MFIKKILFQKLLISFILCNNFNFNFASTYKTTSESQWLNSQENIMVGENNEDLSGYSVAINGNGTILAIGEPGYSNSQGRTKTFILAGSNWSEIGNITGENNGDLSGSCVTLNEDGAILAIGEPGYSGSAGRTKIFVLTGSNWSEIGNITGENIGDLLGSCVALNQEGDTVVITEPGFNNSGLSGAAQIHQFINNNWQKVKTITNVFSVSDTLGKSATINNGQDYVISIGSYIINSKTNQIQETKLNTDISSVSYNGTGNILIIGSADNDEVTINKSYFESNYILPNSSDSQFGYCVKVSRDGTCFIIGSPNYNNGAVSILKNHHKIYNIYGRDQVSQLGYSIASDNSAKTIVIGAPGDNDTKGITLTYFDKPIINAPIYQGNNKNNPNKHLPGTPTDISQPNHGDGIPTQTNL